MDKRGAFNPSHLPSGTNAMINSDRFIIVVNSWAEYDQALADGYLSFCGGARPALDININITITGATNA